MFIYFLCHRYSLAFLDIKTTTVNDSYVKGNSFNYNFNTALGVFTTNNLLVENNVVYFTLGASMRIEGEMNQLIHNLVIYSASLATYKGREDRFDPHWPGAIDTEEAQSVVLIDNAIGKNMLNFTSSHHRHHRDHPSKDYHLHHHHGHYH
jgi:hypothetical protein